MNHRCWAAIGILLLSVAPGGHGQHMEVIGYYPSWKWNSRNNLVSPERIPYEKLTLINYAFFVPHRDGSITGKDSTGDALYLRCTPGTTIIDLAHAHGVRIVLSLGGWEDSWNFPFAASDAGRRAKLAHSCLEAVRSYGFDGIDIDWEFPGLPEHNGTAADRGNFTLLLRALRDSLAAQERSSGRRYLLTAALPAGGSNLATIEAARIAEILDMLNIMTYDFYGPWDPLANHNSPLYPSTGSDPSRCVDSVFKLFHTTLHIPASKINLGIPFYGHTYTHCIALNTPHGSADTVHFSKFGACYYDIDRQLGDFTRTWDEGARVPYLVSSARDELISYDDTQSTRAKARYATDHHACGLIIWEITGDYLDNGTTPLLNVIADELRHRKHSRH